MSKVIEFTSKYKKDKEGNPSGGKTTGVGINIDWQDGPLGTGEDRVEPNGAFVETLIKVCIDRLEYFQASKFVSGYNARAIDELNNALYWLNARTTNREERGVEGTHNE